MKLLVALTIGVFAVSFFSQPLAGGGWWWDAGNAVGLMALAGLLYLAIPATGGRALRQHELLAYLVVALIVLHGLWLFAGDGAALAYIRPGAPLYMWAGVLALALLMVSSAWSVLPDRVRRYRSYPRFKAWHRTLGGLALAGAVYHVLASGFYFNSGWELAAVVALGIGAGFARELRIAPASAQSASPMAFALLGTLAATGFVLLRNLP